MTDGHDPAWDSPELQRAIFEQVGDYVLLLAPHPAEGLVIVDASDAALRAHGYERAEVVGRSLSLLEPDASPADFAAHVRDLETGNRFMRDLRHRRKDGTFFDVEVRAALVRVGGRRLVLSVERDITERKQAEARLEQAHRLMGYVISHARSAIAVHDRALRYVYVSERYLKEYGVAERDVVGRHHYEVFPDLPQKWRDVHQRALAGEVSSAEEDPYVRADGSVEWTRWECRPWYEADGSIGGIVVYTEVITDRKRAEEERRALEGQLHQAMKMEAVGRLAGGIAHDFNNLLTAITANVELGLLDLVPDDRLAVRLHEIGDAAASAAGLTRQLLAFSRKQVAEPKVVDLNRLVRSARKLLDRLIGEDVTLDVRLGEGVPHVRVDPGQLEQALVNLAINARDAMPGGGTLTVETTRAGDRVRLAVRDTGHGMTDEVKSHLFEPFFTTKGRGQGTGLGLATAFGMVKQAGGTIEVDSEVGRGTSFTIDLPCVEDALARVDAAGGVLPGGRETVLLVEDDARVRQLALELLVRLGYSVITAANGEEALARLEGHPGRLDLLMTDVVMPGLNGREVAERVARRHPETRVLYVSGYTDNVIAHHGVLEPGLSFLAKPYTPQRLAEKIRETLAAFPPRPATAG